mgnify:CR=1 FL=1
MEETNKFKGCKSGFTITEELKQKDKIKTRLLKFIIFKKRTENEVFNKFKDIPRATTTETMVKLLVFNNIKGRGLFSMERTKA